MIVWTALGDKGVSASISVTGLSRSLSVSVTTIAVSRKTLGASVGRAGSTIWMVSSSGK